MQNHTIYTILRIKYKILGKKKLYNEEENL